MRDLFASDYGVLDEALLGAEYVTNPAELLRSEELYGILRLCGVGADEGSAAASDLELFLSFCRAFPLLRGHLVALRLETLLRQTLSLSLPLCEEHAVTLWRESTERLKSSPLRLTSLLSPTVPWLCEREEYVGKVLTHLPFVYSAELLFVRRGETLGSWHARVRSTVERLAASGSVGVRLCLPEDYHFSAPNPYAVETALARTRRDAAAKDLLLSQLAREVSEACVAAGLPLTVEFACDTSASELLRYVRSTVGLPEVTVAAGARETRNALIGLSAELDLRIALRLSDTPTAAEMRAAMESVAARYPIGRVRLITGADLRQSAAAQAQAESFFA